MALLQGADIFRAKVNLEVQVASEKVIATVERNGGVITTSYFDPRSLRKYAYTLLPRHIHICAHKIMDHDFSNYVVIDNISCTDKICVCYFRNPHQTSALSHVWGAHTQAPAPW